MCWKLALGAALAISCVLSPGIANADDDPATKGAVRQLGEEGVSAYQEGRFADAHEKLSRAYQLSPLPTLGLWHARSLEKLGRWVEASERYLQVTKLTVDKDPRGVHAQAKQDAETERAQLLPKIPKLVVEVTGAAAEKVEIELDGKPLPSGILGVERPTDPGTHRLIARSGTQSETRQVALAEGQVQRVAIAFKPEAAAAPSPTPPEPAAPASAPAPAAPVDSGTSAAEGPPVLAWVALGIGGAGLAVGTVTGIMALGKQSQLEDDCDDERCGPDLHDDVDSYNQLRTISFVSLAVGAVGVGTGLVLLTTSGGSERGATIQPLVGLGSAGVRGRF